MTEREEASANEPPQLAKGSWRILRRDPGGFCKGYVDQ